MPVQPTYPGVYVQEVPSGVRTIVGVSTSVTAFVGTAKRGPIHRAVTIFNFSEFETIYGGLSGDSEMSYGVRQFFNNGGSQAIIIRVAHNAITATRTLQDDTPVDALTITAIDAGSEGNNIEVRVDHNTSVPDSTFNLTINYAASDNPGDVRTETFSNLSMNSEHPRYAEDVINEVSQLVTVSRVGTPPNVAGTASSAVYANVATTLGLLDATHNRFRVAINGSDPLDVILNVPADTGSLADLCSAIQTAVVNQANGNAAISGFTCAPDGDSILMSSAGETGENSRVEVLPGLSNDASTALELTIAAGGSQVDAVASIRPAETPARATLTSGDIAQADLGADGAMLISLDGSVPLSISVNTSDLATGDHDADMAVLAQRIQDGVRALKPGVLSYREFTASVIPGTAAGDRRLVLATGSRGTGATIVVSVASSNDMAAGLNLLDGVNDAASSFPIDTMLENGSEEAVTTANAYNNYIGSRANREGIFALEAKDIFNILCLPGVHDPGILADSEAYCRERRAFMIVDPDPTVNTPSAMATEISGTAFPNSDHAAVYFPWIKIADPLKGGKLRISAPSGTMAGLYSRTDSNRGVWKAPAGTEANLVGVQEMNYTLTDPENGMLNPLGANCLRTFPVYGAVSWGARTLNGADQIASEYKYVPVRRLALFIEESLYRGLKWAVFEPNDEPLWAQIRLNVGAFMQNLFRQGAFQGQKRDQAYFVKCDSETTTQNDINLGVVNVWVGFAPLKPAEFVILHLQQIAGQIEV